MFFWIVNAANQTFQEKVTHEVLLRSLPSPGGNELISNLGRFHPLEFARATNGYVYMVDGLNAPIKWNGVGREVVSVGVRAPTTAITFGATGQGELSGRYRVYLRFVDNEGNVSNLSPASNIIIAEDNLQFTYQNVEVPTENKVVRKQVLRNTDGQFTTFYVDIDTTDIAATSLSSTKDDTALRTGQAVPFFNEDFTLVLANRAGLPPDDKPIIAFYQGRLWLYGEVVYGEGSVSVTNGSTAITGHGTQWTAEMDGRLFYPEDEDRAYVIESINEASQTGVLESAYVGSTNLFTNYKIRPTTARRHILAHSEANRFDAWPAQQTLEVASADDVDDDPAGLASTHSYLYIIQRRHMYRLAFLEQPTTDGAIFLAARRGCVNNRAWLNIDDWLYALDDRGIYRFDGASTVEDLSPPIQDLFYFHRDAGELRINWNASRLFHAGHDRHNATIRWFVALSGNRLPRHAICFNYSTPQWWLEEYPFAIGDSTNLKGVSSPPVVAGKARKVYAMQVGTLDIVDPDEGATRGQVSSWTYNSVTLPSGAVMPPAGVAGTTVAIVDGRGKGQIRLVASISGQTLTVVQPWTIEPDTASTVQIGATPWRWQSGWSEWLVSEEQLTRKIAVGFQPAGSPNKMDLRVYADYSRTPIAWDLDWPRIAADSSGMETSPDDPDAEIDLATPKGYSYLQVSNLAMVDEFREDIVSIELRGHSGASPTVIYEVDLQGAQRG